MTSVEKFQNDGRQNGGRRILEVKMAIEIDKCQNWFSIWRRVVVKIDVRNVTEFQNGEIGVTDVVDSFSEFSENNWYST